LDCFDQFTLLALHATTRPGVGEFVTGVNKIPKARASVLYARAGHELKVGFQYQSMDYSDYRKDNDYGLSYVFSNGLPVSLEQRAYDYGSALTMRDLGIYAQDKWTWNRAYNWEFSAGIQQQLAPRVSADVGYFRRVYGNLLVTDNRALTPADYDRYSIMAPIDPRLPNGGGYVISDLYDLKPEKVAGGTVVNNLETFASNLGDQIEHWNGVDVNVNARLPHEITLQGGFSTGRTTTDNCDVVTKVDNPSPLYCHVQTNFLTDAKAVASYTIPRVDLRLSGTFQSIAGPPISASYVVSNAEVMKSLPRGLSGGRTTVVVNLVAPGTMYGERLNQVDLRFSKLFRWGHSRITANLDIYNALNSDTC
jgi:hypothetical protein